MRFSRAFLPTLKETPAEAQTISHVYLIRGGYIRQLAAGIYNFLPLGWRVIHKIETIVREEMERAGAQEVLMPAAIPAELWRESGRWDEYGPELLRFKDRKDAEFCFGPTHEEVAVDMVRRDTRSYRDMPLSLYQIQSKFRDEARPRAGLMRGREFIMKDAYSFDVSPAAARKTYDAMYEAYSRIFRRCGLDVRAVEADTGAIGGSRSHEFQALADSGEDSLVTCSECEYAANVEQAEILAPAAPGIAAPKSEPKSEQASQLVGQDAGAPSRPVLVATPGARTIDEVAAFLRVPREQTIKTLLYMADGAPVAVCVRGDRAVNEVALKRALGASELTLARDGQVADATGAPVGFVGPVGLTEGVALWADNELFGATGAVCGANQPDAHLTGVDMARDAARARFSALRMAQPGDVCPRCKRGTLGGHRGIEVGHVFFLGTTYTAPLGATFLDENGQIRIMEMGCYGIGITRVATAAIEQNHDPSGIVWPVSIAPYEIEVVPLQMSDPKVVEVATSIYEGLGVRGIEAMIDDRDERPGTKFKDADLIGIPLRITVGARSLADGVVEIKWRKGGAAELVDVHAAIEHAAALIEEARARLRNAM